MNRFIKKLLAVLCILALLSSLSGCVDNQNDADNSEVNSEEANDMSYITHEEIFDSLNNGIVIDAVSDKVYKPTDYANPVSSNIFCADPTSVVYEGRLYVYGTNDTQQRENKDSNSYEFIKTLVCFSTDDMVNWVYHGAIPVGEIAPWIYNSWAPSITSRVEEDGLTHFYLYFSNGGAGCGVITATSPTGPWSDPLGEPLVYQGMPGLDNCPAPFDPGVVIDDNGVGWLSFGGGNDGKLHSNVPKIARLGEDLLSFDSEFVSIDAPFFCEASELNYIDGTFYYSYSTDWTDRKIDGWDYENHEPPATCSMAYMTTTTPLDADSWEYRGDFFYNAGQNAQGGPSGLSWCNNHTHIQEFEGVNYIIHHTMFLEGLMAAEGGFRSIMVDYLPMDPATGEIPKAAATKDGVAQIKLLDPYKENSGSTIMTSAEIDHVMLDNVGNASAKSLNKGSWLMVKNADFGYGASEFIASVKGKGRIEIRLDSLENEPVTAIEFDVDEFTNIRSTAFKEFEGRNNDIYIVFSDADIELKAWRFEKGEAALRPEEEIVDPEPVAAIQENVPCNFDEVFDLSSDIVANEITVATNEGVWFLGNDGVKMKNPLTAELLKEYKYLAIKYTTKNIPEQDEIALMFKILPARWEDRTEYLCHGWYNFGPAGQTYRASEFSKSKVYQDGVYYIATEDLLNAPGFVEGAKIDQIGFAGVENTMTGIEITITGAYLTK